MAAPINVEVLKKMKDDAMRQLATLDQRYNEERIADGKDKSSAAAELEKQQKIIERMEELLASVEDGEAVVGASWAIHGEPGVIPLCVVECPECDNSEIDEIQKDVIEEQIRDINEEREQLNSELTDNERLLSETEEELRKFILESNEAEKRREEANILIDDHEDIVAAAEKELEEAIKLEDERAQAFTNFKTNLNAEIGSMKEAAGNIDDEINALWTEELRKCDTDNDGYPIGDAGSPCQATGDVMRSKQGDINELSQKISEAEGNLAAATTFRDEQNAAFDLLKIQKQKEINEGTEIIEATKGELVDLEKDVVEALEKVAATSNDAATIRAVITNISNSLYRNAQDKAEAERFLSQIMSDCDECGTWRIIRAGTENSEEGPDCLLGWEYSEDGDILVDESRVANNVRFVSLYNKPDTLLIDKRGDVWADGEKVARVAVSGIVGRWFDNFTDPTLPQLMINPRFIGNNRIFHVMQDGFHIMCEKPNSLRDELARHELIPYHIGDYFVNRAKHCDDHEEGSHHDEDCKIECCGPPELPDCFDIGDCPVTIPEWFKEWYGLHQDNLYLKLPYDKRYEGDPLRYTHEGQILFGNAFVDLIVRYFNSTPLDVEDGFNDWFVDRGLNRILNILPLIHKNSPPRSRFSLSNWTFGTNSNSPKISLPVDSSVGECVECCDLIDSSCGIMLTFDDCCEFACGRWSADCSYTEGDIVISKSGEACYEAMIDICAGDCNPEPGKAAETIWRKCTIDCENDAPICDFTISDQFLCDDKDCDARVKVGALYELNQSQCEYVWTFTARNVYGMADDVVVESFGYAPGDSFDETSNIVVASVPLLPVGCEDSSVNNFNPNTWIFTLEARASESNRVLSWCQSQEKELELSCGFSVEVWDGVEAAMAEAYNWCDEKTPDNPTGRRAAAPSSAIAEVYTDLERFYEEFVSYLDGERNTSTDFNEFNSIINRANLVVQEIKSNYGLSVGDLEAIRDSAIASVQASDFEGAEKMIQDLVFGIISVIDSNDIYVGVEDCCCIFVKPDDASQAVCDLSWVWLVRSDINDRFVPYYGGVGLQPAASVLCVERNPDQYNVTNAEVVLMSYAASCDEVVRARIEGWDGVTPWFSSQDGFTALSVCECYRQQSVTCPCSPRDGIANMIPGECDIQNFSQFPVELSHVNPFNECTVRWVWQVNRTGANPVEFAGGVGTSANTRNINLISGESYDLMLRWKSEDETSGGIVWQQSYDVPVCPVLDLTFDNSFTDTIYGEITTGTAQIESDALGDNHQGVIIDAYPGTDNEFWFTNEVDSDTDNPSILFVNTADSDPHGTFKILAQHTPNLEDPHWLAVDPDEYRWQWHVAVRHPDNGALMGEFSTGILTSLNGKAPDFTSSDLSSANSNLVSEEANSYVYEITLRAILASSGVMVEQNQTQVTNDNHKGLRRITNVVAGTVASGDYFNIAIGTINGQSSAYPRQISYRPMVDCTGQRTQQFKVFSTWANGDSATTNATVVFNVVGDPCQLTGTYCDSVEIISAPNTIEAGGTGTVVYEARLETGLNDECGELTNPNTTIVHELTRAIGVDVDGEIITENVPFEVISETVTAHPHLLTVIRFECEYDVSENYSSSPSASFDGEFYGSINIAPNVGSYANFAKELSYRVLITTSDDCEASKLDPTADSETPIFAYADYQQCWDGSYIRRDYDGNPLGNCPCPPIDLDDSYSWDDITASNPVYTYAPQDGVDGAAALGNVMEINLTQFVIGPQFGGNWVPKFMFSGHTSSNFNAQLKLDQNGNTVPTLVITALTELDGVDETISVPLEVYNQADWGNYEGALAGGENCVKSFTLELDMKTGCGTNQNASNYYLNANIGNAFTGLNATDPQYQPVCVCAEVELASSAINTVVKDEMIGTDPAEHDFTGLRSDFLDDIAVLWDGEIKYGNANAPGAIEMVTIRLGTPFQLDDTAATAGAGTMLTGSGFLKLDLKKLFNYSVGNGVDDLSYRTLVGPNVKEGCAGTIIDGSMLRIRFGEPHGEQGISSRHPMNQTPEFFTSTSNGVNFAKFEAARIDASDCQLSSDWDVIHDGVGGDYRNTIKSQAASLGAVYYLVEAHDPECPEAVRRILIRVFVDTHQYVATCRKQSPEDTTPCSEGFAATGQVHNPDLCCFGVNVTDTTENDLVNNESIGYIDQQSLSWDLNGGTSSGGQEYDIKLTIGNGAFPITGQVSHAVGNHIGLRLDELFSPVRQSDVLEYSWSVGANPVDGSGGSTGNTISQGGELELFIGINDWLFGSDSYRHSISSPENVGGQRIASAQGDSEILYTVKAINTSCDECDDVIESDEVKILVEVQEQSTCIQPSNTTAVRAAMASALETSFNFEAGNTPSAPFAVADASKLSVSWTTGSGAPQFEGIGALPVVRLKFEDGYFNFPDEWITRHWDASDSLNLGSTTGGLRMTIPFDDCYNSVDELTTYQTQVFDWDDASGTYKEEAQRSNSSPAFELGYHTGTSAVTMRLRTRVNAAEGRATIETQSAPNRALVVFAKNGTCPEAMMAIIVEFEEHQRIVPVGCMDPIAFNYDENALINDGICTPVLLGCTDPTACNYDSLANTDDGSCELPKCCFSESHMWDGLNSTSLSVIGYDSIEEPNANVRTDRIHSQLMSKAPPDIKIMPHGGYGIYNCLSQWQQLKLGAYTGRYWGPNGDRKLTSQASELYWLIKLSRGFLSSDSDPNNLSLAEYDTGYKGIVLPAVPAGSDVAEKIYEAIANLHHYIKDYTQRNSFEGECEVIQRVVEHFAVYIYNLGQLNVQLCGPARSFITNSFVSGGADGASVVAIVSQTQKWSNMLGINNWNLTNVKAWLTAGVEQNTCGTDCRDLDDATPGVTIDGNNIPSDTNIEGPFEQYSWYNNTVGGSEWETWGQSLGGNLPQL